MAGGTAGAVPPAPPSVRVPTVSLLAEIIRHRRMTRDFTEEPVDPTAVRELLDLARRAPSAGFTQGVEFLVIDEPSELWAITLPAERRAEFPWPGLLRAPVIVVPLADEAAYRDRYGEPDKAATGLGTGEWTVPYWFVDAAFATQNLLLLVAEAGLGALFFGLFEQERRVLDRFGVPASVRAIGAVALGHPGPDDRPSHSAQRDRRDADAVVHWGHW